MSLSDNLSSRIGKETSKGTKITESLIESVRGDEQGILIIKEDNTEQIVKAINKQIVAALEEIGLKAERYAKLLTPVDTGRLRNSVTHAIRTDEDAVYIGTNVEYAPYVENDRIINGKKYDGAHFLRDAATQHKDEYGQILKRSLKGGN